MRYRRLGATDLEVSVVALGTNSFGAANHSASVPAYGKLGRAEMWSVVDAALDAGINFFDTAEVYGHGGSETFLGDALRGRRHLAVIATKWGAQQPPDVAWGERSHVRRALEASLRRLGTDYVDLYQMHFPDPKTPWEETLGALDELIREGKVRHAGSSQLAAWQLVDADWTARAAGHRRLATIQSRYNLLERGAASELVPACLQTGVALLPFFPLANGLLTGKYRRGSKRASGRLAGRVFSDATYDRLDALANFAAERGHSLLELAIGWLANRPAVGSVVAGATSAEQVRANAEASDWELSDEDLAALAEI